jgi:hypothetical protein
MPNAPIKMKSKSGGSMVMLLVSLAASGLGLNAASLRPFAVPGFFGAQEMIGARGPCAGTANPCVLEQKVNYRFDCNATHCQGVELTLETQPLDQKLGIKNQAAKIFLTQMQLDKNEEVNFSCSTGGKVITESNTIESKVECKPVVVTSCDQKVTSLDRPAFTKTFLRPSSALQCNIAPVLPTAATLTGFTEMSLYRATPVNASLPPMTDKLQYCSGKDFRSSVEGKSVDRTKGRKGGWSGFVAGRPYPCIIESHFHLNLGPGHSGGVTNNCPSGYSSRFIRMSGTAYFKCSQSSTRVNCRNTDKKRGRDMDTILFECNFHG